MEIDDVKRKSRFQKGAASIEAAIVLFLFLVPLFMGIIDASLAIYNAQVITNASREGARYGIKVRHQNDKLTETEMIDEIIEPYCSERLLTWDSEPSYYIDLVWSNPNQRCDTYEDTLTVSVIFKYSPLFLGILLPEITLQETTYMKCEGSN